jgi:hypothetical protein
MTFSFPFQEYFSVLQLKMQLLDANSMEYGEKEALRHLLLNTKNVYNLNSFEKVCMTGDRDTIKFVFTSYWDCVRVFLQYTVFLQYKLKKRMHFVSIPVSIHQPSAPSKQIMDLLNILLSQEREAMVMRQKARRLVPTCNAVGSSPSSTNLVWRHMVVEWCYFTIDSVGADRELVYIAMDILDRFLELKSSYLRNQTEYEKAATAALLITAKLYADDYICPRRILLLTENSSTTTRDIMDTTSDIYSTLSWETSIPTAARFVKTLVGLIPSHSFQRAGKSRSDVFQEAVYQIELSVQDAIYSSFPASLVAWMALENVIESMNLLTTQDLQHFRFYVAGATGHEYNMELRGMLRSFNVPIIIPDETQKPHPSTIKPRSLKNIPSVSIEDMRGLMELEEKCSLHRSNRSDQLRNYNE